jgi:hypothetical protein
MNPESYIQAKDAIEFLGVSKQWFYKLKKKYGYRTRVLFGKTVYFKRDIEKTPSSALRRSIAQRERWKKLKQKEASSRITT